MFNKGYKKCNKKKYINNPSLDIVDCNINIFNHAKQNNYNNIIVLEDDFIFSPKIKNNKIINDINNFINSHDNYIYLLGCLPIFMIECEYKSCQYSIGVGLHAAIFSKKYRENILSIKQKLIYDWELYNWNFIKNRYCYQEPLCYQLFYKTENSKYWGHSTPLYYFIEPAIILFKLLKLDKQPEFGFYFFYTFAKYFWIIILYLIVSQIICSLFTN